VVRPEIGIVDHGAQPVQGTGKPWSNVFDGWMRDPKIRRDCMIFICVVLILVLAAVVLSGPGVLAALVRIAASPITWITGGSVLLGEGGVVALRRRSRRRALKMRAS